MSDDERAAAGSVAAPAPGVPVAVLSLLGEFSELLPAQPAEAIAGGSRGGPFAAHRVLRFPEPAEDSGGECRRLPPLWDPTVRLPPLMFQSNRF